MKGKMLKILQLFVFAVFLCASSFAQIKIAVIDTDAFYDEMSGILELVAVNKQLEAEFQSAKKELKSLNEKLMKFAIEIDNCARDSCKKRSKEEAEEVILEVENLSKKISSINEEINPRIEKRKAEIVEPVFKKVTEKLKLFEREKGYAKILDLADDKVSDVVLYVDESFDITSEFIKFCNEEFEKEKAQKQ